MGPCNFLEALVLSMQQLVVAAKITYALSGKVQRDALGRTGNSGCRGSLAIGLFEQAEDCHGLLVILT